MVFFPLPSSPMRVLVVDRQTYSLSARKITDEGYLSAPARVAKTGIQKYLASELGITDRDPNELISVYRPAEEVFSQDSLETYLHKEITDNHPTEFVSAENYKQYSVGQVVSKGAQDGEYVRIDLMIKDAEAISAAQSGKSELSSGYYADYMPEPGKTEDGEEYEFVQRNIVVNHVALVDVARAGPGARIFDKKPGGNQMPRKVTLDNGRTVEVEDNTAALIEDSFERLTKRATDAEAALKAKDEEVQKEKARADEAEEEAEKEKEKSSDAAIQAKVDDRMTVVDSARKLVEDFDVKDKDGKIKSVDAIKREVVATLHPKRDWKNADAAYINATFDMDVEKSQEEEDEEDIEKVLAKDSHQQLAKDLSGQSGKTNKVTDGRAIIRNRITDAWKEREAS